MRVPSRFVVAWPFHVILPDQKEIVFRLYFVDRPEEEPAYADRYLEQAGAN
jgi:hypothetical protein